YEGDPETFELNPTRWRAVARFVRIGIRHAIGERVYLWFVVGVALVFLRVQRLVSFAAVLICAEFVALMAALAWLSPAPWLPGVPSSSTRLSRFICRGGRCSIVPMRLRSRRHHHQPRARWQLLSR